MRTPLSLRRDEAGTALIEMAFALPVLIMFIWGIFQLSIALQASAGMQHALGEAARYATIFPTPSDDEIKKRIADKVFGTGVGTFATPTITKPASTVCNNCKDLTVTFTMPMNFLFFSAPDIKITRAKRIYLAS